MTFKYMLALATAFSLTPAWAINKCIDSSGKISYQERACEGSGAELKIRQQSAPVPPVERKVVAPPVSSAPVAAPAEKSAVQSQPAPAQKSELEIKAEQCLSYYKPKLRDPARSYFTDVSLDKTLLTMKMHATNGYGGYVTRAVSCEFKQNGDLDADWTKIHAQRIGW